MSNMFGLKRKSVEEDGKIGGYAKVSAYMYADIQLLAGKSRGSGKSMQKTGQTSCKERVYVLGCFGKNET